MTVSVEELEHPIGFPRDVLWLQRGENMVESSIQDTGQRSGQSIYFGSPFADYFQVIRVRSISFSHFHTAIYMIGTSRLTEGWKTVKWDR